MVALSGCHIAYSSSTPGTSPSPSPSSLLAEPDQYTTHRNIALYVGDATGVLANDTCKDPVLSFPKRTEKGGLLRGYSQGSFFYTPPADFEGTDSFSYSLIQSGKSSTTTVSLAVQANQRSKLSIDLYSGSWNFQLVKPTDPGEFQSYLQAQVAGGALEGKTSIFQKDALPNTRLAQVVESRLWDSALSRNYACQLAAQALGYDPLEPEGIRRAAEDYPALNAEAQLFLQVAAVFKGDLLGGPGKYDNEGLKKLLLSKGLEDLANSPEVGKTDVHTLGAVARAMNSGQLTILDILNSGTFEDVRRYDQVVEYVYSGKFRDSVTEYEAVTIQDLK